jgi:glycosyltransferase involved in cell wall biosynthesis
MRPARVIHIVENLNRGAVENWLLRMLRHARKQRVEVDWTFYCISEEAGRLENEVQNLGSTIIHSPVPIGNKIRFMSALRSELQHGKYDVLHSHHDLISAVYLAAAMGTRIRRRIVHVHNADEQVLTPSRIKQWLYREPLRRVCLWTADRIVGNSNHSLDTFLVGGQRYSTRDIVHYYGVDSTPFQNAKGNRREFLRKLSLPENAKILLFAHRMVPEKNPLFAVDVLQAMRRMDSTVVGVFAGSGSLEESVRQRAVQHGLSVAFRHLGWRDDVAEVMSCCDWFILPHPEQAVEGFGLAVVEAQLAGLRLLLSRGVPDDPLLPTARFRRLPLCEGADAWANAAMELLRDPAPLRTAALDALRKSPFEMDVALTGLVAIHECMRGMISS